MDNRKILVQWDEQDHVLEAFTSVLWDTLLLPSITITIGATRSVPETEFDAIEGAG